MVDNYEALSCAKCGSAFLGRKPAEGGAILCHECMKAEMLQELQRGAEVPGTVASEMEGGKGDAE